MAKYLILIYGDEQRWASLSPDEQREIYTGHDAFREAAGTAILSGQQLEPSATATTLRADPAGGHSVTDGPFLETKEGLGGYYLVEATDLDAVSALAAILPEVAADHSGVEIRPVVEHG